MIKAEQQALFQSTNQQVLSIRQIELDYFQSFYSNIGLQATIVAGFVISGLTGTNAQELDADNGMKNLFWVAGSISFGFSITSMMTSMFINIYGPGLALHGPLGSISRSITGMQAELHETLWFYIFSLIFLSLSALALFWVVRK